MADCLIALGSNVGDRAALLDQALEQLDQHPDVCVTARSRFLRSWPVGGPLGQAEFLNAAARLDTPLSADSLLDVLQRIENDMGRQRLVRWDARPIDIDLLLYDQLVHRSARLTLPHPRMTFRRFVLEPAAEVGAELVHPSTGWTVLALLNHLNEGVDYLAVACTADLGHGQWLQAIADHGDAILIRDPGPATPLMDEPVDTVDSSGRKLSPDLQLLRRRAAALQAIAEGEVWISDFWFGQWLVEARRQLAGAQLEQGEAAWRTLAERLVAPKLLVLLDPPGDPPSSDPASPVAGLRDFVLHEYRRPVLHLETADRTIAIAEFSAALQTMRRLPE